jgi:hypothetical protein
VKKFNEAQVNGGSNYDSLVGERFGFTSDPCLESKIVWPQHGAPWARNSGLLVNSGICALVPMCLGGLWDGLETTYLEGPLFDGLRGVKVQVGEIRLGPLLLLTERWHWWREKASLLAQGSVPE